MENLQMLNDLPTIDVWVNTDFSPLIKIDYHYAFQGRDITKLDYEDVLDKLDYEDVLDGSFTFLYREYTKSINIKRVGYGVVNQANINVVVAPCLEFKDVVSSLYNITPEVYNWCKSNNVKIVVSYARETLYPDAGEIFDNVIKHCVIKRGFDSSVIKIIINSYNNPENTIYTDYVVPIDTFRRTLYSRIVGTNNDPDEIVLSKNRTYNFSLLTGALSQRPHRIIFLSKCHDLNLLNDKFFYSVFMLDNKRDMEYIKQVAKESEHGDVILKASKIFQHKTYDINGKILGGDENIYTNLEEYFIPPQVLDSYVHIVLETTDRCYSLTEKIFKPIAAGLPFIWQGCQNILPYLESLGFKRYNYIDYSFDSDPDPEKRLELLIKEVQRLNKVDLKMLAYTNRKISKYNQQVFKSICKDYNDLWEHLK